MIHPETGEVLTTQADFKAAFERLEEKMLPDWRVKYALQSGYAALFEAADLPRARSRTSTQEKVARCPRCGMKLEEDEG